MKLCARFLSESLLVVRAGCSLVHWGAGVEVAARWCEKQDYASPPNATVRWESLWIRARADLVLVAEL